MTLFKSPPPPLLLFFLPGPGTAERHGCLGDEPSLDAGCPPQVAVVQVPAAIGPAQKASSLLLLLVLAALVSARLALWKIFDLSKASFSDIFSSLHQPPETIARSMTSFDVAQAKHKNVCHVRKPFQNFLPITNFKYTIFSFCRWNMPPGTTALYYPSYPPLLFQLHGPG